MIEIALYQPDIAQNTGTIARLCDCLGLQLTIIEPAGFAWTDASLRRAGMDYLARLQLERVASWQAFAANRVERRLVLLTTAAKQSYVDFAFASGDVLVLGRESAGVPASVHDMIASKIKIPMVPPARSLNVAVACAMVAGEALRQTKWAPATSAGL
jgi:tRNA (cytidine/uridine-2'-O-)-methyltransferase